MRPMISISLLFGSMLLAAACSTHRPKAYKDPCDAPVIQQSFVHKYGMKVDESEWKQRGENGQTISTLKSGIVVSATYVNGLLHGEVSYTFPHSGSLQKIETYDFGQLIMEQEMNPSGKRKRQIEYLSPNETQVTGWYDNGALQFREKYEGDQLVTGAYYSTNGQLESRVEGGDGMRTYRDEFGHLLSQAQVENGCNVLETRYHPNGMQKEIVPYNQGMIHGQKKTFLSGGEPMNIEEWANGKQDGITVEYHNGEKSAEVPYENGLKNGIERRFKDGRFVAEEITWKNGHKHGSCRTYIGEGVFETWFYDGQEVSKRQYERMIMPKPR